LQIGQRLLVKHDGRVRQGIVIKIFSEELDIKLEDEIIVRRKFWEVKKLV
jgi:hypothetical protein